MADDFDFADFDAGNSSDYQTYDGGDSADFDFGSVPLGSLTNLVGVGGPSGGAVFQPTMGAVPAAAGAAMGAIASLGGRLAAMMGRGAGAAVINGVKFSMASLWPYIRKYGPTAVATALGISVAQLGTLAMNAPQGGRKRRRGISAADVRRTTRVLRFNQSLNRRFGRFGGGGGRGRARRGRHAHYFN